MGLDNFFEETEQSPNEIAFPPDLHLCGGMFSGHGSSGSFRGKVYTEFFQQELEVSLYSDQTPEDVAKIAEKLAALLCQHPNEAWEEKWLSADTPYRDLGYYGVSSQEIRDFAALFKAAAEQHLKLEASY